MTPTLRAEVRKARFTRSLWALPAIGLCIAAVGAVLLVTIVEGAEVPSRLSQLGPLRFGPTNFGLLLLVVGIRTFADETQHRTLSSTFVRRPSRHRVAAAKGLVASAIAIGFCVAADLITIPIIAIGLSARSLPMTYDLAATGAMLARVALAMVLLSALGVALGAAIRNRTVAMVSAVVWFALGEDIVGALLHVGRYLPGAAVQGLVSNTSTPTHPAAVASTLVLVGYLALAAATAAVSLRRDLT